MAAQNENINKESQPTDQNLILTWKSPSRPFKKRDKEFFTTIGAIVFLIAVILFLLKEFLLIGVILALMFVIYVLSTTEPEMVEHSITKDGLVYMGQIYKWDELSAFWFTEKWGQTILTVSSKFKRWGRVIILLPKELKEKIKDELQVHLTFKEIPEKNWMDNAAEWLAKKIPLETES